MAFPLDFYAARSVICAAILESYPVDRNPDALLTAAQREKRHAANFMTDERLTNRKVGAFLVEIATGVFMESRMVELTAFRYGGEREGDSDLCVCVHSVEEMTAHLESLMRISCAPYYRGFSDYDAIRDTASNPHQIATEVTTDEYEEMLGVVPPIYADDASGFLVGEALTSDSRGAVYANYFQRDGRYWARYHVIKK